MGKAVSTADTLERCFTSPNVPDANLETANLVDVVDRVGRAIQQLADGVCVPGIPFQADDWITRSRANDIP